MALVRPLYVGFSSATRVARLQLGSLEVTVQTAEGPRVFVLSEEVVRKVDLNLERWRREEHEATLLAMNDGNLGETLGEAAQEGGLRDTMFLLASGANVNYSDFEFTALARAAGQGHLATVTVLVDAGAGADEEGWTPGTGRNKLSHAAHCAAAEGHTHVVALLLDRGADVHYDDDGPLRDAASSGNLETVLLLLNRGADLHAVDDSPLRLSALEGHLETVRFLLDRGADVHATDGHVLASVLSDRHAAVHALLVERGAVP